MRFRNFGGIHQFMVSSDADLARIDGLDPARWAATSAPIKDLHCDEGFLRYLDPDNSERVRVSQIVKARDWTYERLAKRDVLLKRTETILIDAIDQTKEPGKKLRLAAERVNAEQNAKDTDHITLTDVRGFKGTYQKLLANGDGVMPPDVVPETEVSAFIKDIIGVVGAVRDRGGSDGVNQDLLDKFRTQGKNWLDWLAKGPTARVWGDDTPKAHALVHALDAKLEGWFLQSDLLRLESADAESLRLTPDDLRALRARDSAAIERYLSESPLTAPDARGQLALNAPVNAVYRDQFIELHNRVLKRALGDNIDKIDRDAWRKVKALFEPFAAWQGAKPPENFESLGKEKVEALLAGPLPGRVEHFLKLDKEAQAQIEQIDDLEKLLLNIRWLVELTNNFVNFSAIYRPDATALVETGSLVIDGRRLDFCLRVRDRAAHKPIASESLCFLVYAKVVEKEGGATLFEVVAPVTGGEKGRLRVGKRGIFIDLKGKEFDAQVVELVENPISVEEAAFAPFRRAANFVSGKIEEWVGSAATAQQAAFAAKTEETVTAARANAESVAASVRNPPPPPRPANAPAEPAAPAREGLNINSLVVGGGVALAGVGAIFASLFSALTSLSGWMAIIGIVVVVMALSGLSGWLKLRKRDMALILEANGWAVNVHMTITARIARVFSFTPDLPKDAVLDHTDMLPPAGEDEESGSFTLIIVGAFVALSLLAYLLYTQGYLHMGPR